MYARILVPLDGSELAEEVLPYAQALAKGLRTRIELLRVIEPPPEEMAVPGHGVYPYWSVDNVRSNARDYLEGIASTLREEGLSAFTKVREGRPADWVAAEAELEPDTLVAMSGHGRSGITRWILGSVTDRILHTTSTPVLVIHAGGKEGASSEQEVGNLLVPLDGSPLAEQVLPHVATLGAVLGAKVHLVRANPSKGEYHAYLGHYPMDASATVYTGIYEEFSKEEDARAMEYLHGVKDRLRGMGITSVEESLLKGHAAEVIIDLAQEIPSCMVLMSSHGSAGIGRWILGSVADRVVRYTGVPVLIVRASEEKKVEASKP